MEGLYLTDEFNSFIKKNYLHKWQKTVDVLAKIYNVPAGLIMKLNEDNLEVFVSSKTEGNPYIVGEQAYLNTGLYCEEVIKTKKCLHVKCIKRF